MSKKLYFYTDNNTKKTLKDITKSLFCSDYKNENHYIWESNTNIDKIPDSFWLSNNYSSPILRNVWHIPIISTSDLLEIKGNSEKIKYITWNIKHNEVYYKITLIDFTEKNDGRGYVLVVTLHFEDENYAFMYESPYFTFEDVYSKKEKIFKDMLFLNKPFGSSWVSSVNHTRIHMLLKKTSSNSNYVDDIKDVLSKLSNLKYKLGKENSNEKEFTQYIKKIEQVQKINDNETIIHKVFSHYRQLTHFTKQNTWNKYDEFKANQNVIDIINGKEFIINEPYHPISPYKMMKMKELKSHDELQEDLFNAWQTVVFKSNPYK